MHRLTDSLIPCVAIKLLDRRAARECLPAERPTIARVGASIRKVPIISAAGRCVHAPLLIVRLFNPIGGTKPC